MDNGGDQIIVTACMYIKCKIYINFLKKATIWYLDCIVSSSLEGFYIDSPEQGYLVNHDSNDNNSNTCNSYNNNSPKKVIREKLTEKKTKAGTSTPISSSSSQLQSHSSRSYNSTSLVDRKPTIGCQVPIMM